MISHVPMGVLVVALPLPARENGRFICRPSTPWSPSIEGPVVHPLAIDDGECSEGCCDCFVCPVCGHGFRVEVAQ